MNDCSHVKKAKGVPSCGCNQYWFCKLVLKYGLCNLLWEAWKDLRHPESHLWEPTSRALDRHLFAALVRMKWRRFFLARWIEDVGMWAYYKRNAKRVTRDLNIAKKHNAELKKELRWRRSLPQK